MSPSQRTETIIAPYLTHHISHHGQLTLIPPENAGRIRKPREKKSKSRPRPERNEDELRFNTGAPRSSRWQAASRARRTGQIAQGRQPRVRDDGLREEMTISIPDYPPPSFQEAISTPLSVIPSSVALADTSRSRKAPLTVSSSTHNPHPSSTSTSLPQASSSTTHFQPSSPLSSRASSPSRTPPSPQSLMVNMSRNSDSSSEGSSIEIVDLEPFQTEWEEDRRLGLSLEERVKREWERRTRATEAVRQWQGNAGGEVQSMFEGRGKSRNGRALLDSDDDDGTPEIATTSSLRAPSKKKTHIPSLRTLSPLSHSRTAQERPASPLSPSSVYSLHRSPAAFLKSTTSLGRFPSSSTKSEHSISRRLFSLKGKDKAMESEPLEDWEIVRDEDAQNEGESSLSNSLQDKGKKRAGDARVLLNPPRPAPTNPELNSSLTTSTLHSPTSPSVSSATPTTPTQISMRDRPAPSPPVAFLNRQIRRPAPPPPPSLSATISCAPSIGTSPHPTATSPTRRKPPPPPLPLPKNQENLNPLTVPTAPAPSVAVPPTNPDLDRTFHRALEVPLPVTPVESARSFTSPENNSETPTTPSVGNAPWWRSPAGGTSPTTTLPGMRSHDCYIGVDEHLQSTNRDICSPSSAVSSRAFSNVTTRPTLNLETELSRDYHISNASSCYPRHDVHEDPFVPLTPRALAPQCLSRNSITRPLSRARLPPIRTTSPPLGARPPVDRHYPGRPLPRPPGPVSPLGMSYGLRHGPIVPLVQAGTIPEALLIDFESDCLESALQPEDGQPDHYGIGEFTGARPRSPTVPAPVSTPAPERPIPPVFSQYTDLDLLLSRLEDEDHTGSNYETLLMVSEVVGLATPTNFPAADSLSSPSPLRGKIEIDRRRVTKDGRKKLKLSLLGVQVERCGICLSQFKEDESGMLGECHHAFHEKCLAIWLARNGTCPTCRASLDGHGL